MHHKELRDSAGLAPMTMSGKSEIRISKIETNSNDQNINDQNMKQLFHYVFVLNFDHSDFYIVSDFVFRYSDFTSAIYL